MRRVVLFWALVLGSSCGAAPELSHKRAALGEPKDGFPTWEERVIHMLVNRARSDPQTELAACPGCGEKACYQPVAPLGFSYTLSRSARFHSANLGSCGAFEHPSPCTLVDDIGTIFSPGSCDGAASCACKGGGPPCACTGGACTDIWARIGMFGGSGSGENIAGGGGDPSGTFYMWLYEGSSDTACAFSMSNGHRYNILTQSGYLGVGCKSGNCTQDFGGPGDAIGKISVGTHYPQSGTVTFTAHWYDTAAPSQATVDVDGTCTALTKDRGVDPANATYVLAGQAISGCKRYFFLFKDAAGAQVRYPSTGSFGIGCASDWDSSSPPTGAGCSCTPSCGTAKCGSDGCGGQCGSCGTDQTCVAGTCANVGVDAGVQPSPDSSAPGKDSGTVVGADSGPVAAADAASPASDVGAARGDETITSGCGCATGQGRDVGIAAILLALLARAGRRPRLGAG
jgi:hypothetical protein